MSDPVWACARLHTLILAAMWVLGIGFGVAAANLWRLLRAPR